jgi:serine/threonine protein kinase/peptidoglycan hydrolase-like protein with peptidoglycan-binding domain
MSEKASEMGSAGADSDFVTLRPGRVVGRYRIVSVLGQGGFGITYRAMDSELGREVAIKEYLPAALAIRQDGTTVLPRSTSAAEDFAWGRDRFIAEGRTLAALHRVPGIVLVHDFIVANGTAYLVMELLAGQTLQEQVERRGPLDAAKIDKIVWAVLNGLEQVHSVGFLHRDIKPANILLDGEVRPTLIDFGASRAAVAGRSQAMTAVFTPGYAPVEQFTAAAQGPSTDIYGLAATLHYAITGKAPPNAVDRILDDAYVPLAGGNRPFPRELLAGIDAGLAVRAADRPQSIAAWRTALSPSLGAANATPATVVMRGAPSDTTSIAAPPVTASHKRPVLLLAAGVAAVCALVGGWFTLGPRPTAPPTSTTASIATSPASPTKDRAQEELEQARREQKAALEEAARLRTEAEARRKADEEAALRRKIEEEMRQKVEAEGAARRLAAEESKRQAEAEAKSKSEAEAAARLKAEEADLKAAEAAEVALRLTQPDRQRIQVALTALGFVTGGSDGVFGQRSREMIASWQRKSGRAATGYVSADTQTALLREAAPALTRYDEEQKKLAETRQAPAKEQASSANASGQCEGTYSSEWCRGAFQGFPPSCWHAPMTVRSGAISGSWTSPGASEPNTFTGRINAGGEVQLTYNGIGQQTYTNQHFTVQMTGRVAEGVITAGGRGGSNGRDFTVRLQCR